MLKSFCVKTNNKKVIDYLLHELEYFNMDNIYVSVYKFKIYKNLIIHYTGKHEKMFLKNISSLLAYTIIDFYETILIWKTINSNYFYFSNLERREIHKICMTNIDFKESLKMVSYISNSLYDYLSTEHILLLDGFINFRLENYIESLTSVVDMSVNKYIIDKEYKEFIALLKLYISSSNSNCDSIHLVYKNGKSTLLDASKRPIKLDSSLKNYKYLSDITFSTNDYALNTLLSLVPKKLYLHIKDQEDEFISTLKLIFEDRIVIVDGVIV